MATYPPDSGTFPSLHEMSAGFPPVDWLWPSWIPNSMLTLFAAAPGAGKSLVALDLARRILHNLPFPDGAPAKETSDKVLIVDAEGTPALLYQRARAWGIDSRRIFLMPTPDRTGMIDLGEVAQIRLLFRMICRIYPALVIVDSLAAAIPGSETSLGHAREILGGLAAIARETRTALLVIHHLRKGEKSGWSVAQPQVSASDLRGTSHISAAARSVLALSLVSPPPGLAPDIAAAVEPPSDAEPAATQSPPGPRRRLAVIKTNLCRPPLPLELCFEGEDVAVPKLRYTKWIEPAAEPTQLDLCARWLLEYLADSEKPVSPSMVVSAAKQEGFSRPTLYRARRALAARVVDLGNSRHDPNKRWALATDQPSTSSPT